MNQEREIIRSLKYVDKHTRIFKNGCFHFKYIYEAVNRRRLFYSAQQMEVAHKEEYIMSQFSHHYKGQ